MLKKILLLLLVSLLSLNSCLAYEGKIAFDLDETLIESDKLDRKALQVAEELGYVIMRSAAGQDYIVRPGTYELLDFAKSQGFHLMIMTHNRPKYAHDILKSSGLDKYFDEVRSIEDCREIYNLNFNTYPNHRNNIHIVDQDPVSRYVGTFYDGFVINSVKRFQGNSNIHPYLPCVNCDKYPPIYGARVLFDNSDYNIEDAIDFAGIKVEPFYADKAKERVPEDGDYVWVYLIKKDLKFLKDHEWDEYYQLKFHKKPVLDEVPLIAD
jgi:hypothetical protein